MPSHDERRTGSVVLLLEPLPDEVPENVRVKRALKCLLRAFGLKCTQLSAWPVTGQDATTVSAAAAVDCPAANPQDCPAPAHQGQ